MKTISNYIKLEKDEFKKVKLDFSYQTINRVDKIINYHNNNDEVENNAIFIDIFGLLQSLFVAIDALYTFTNEITGSKSHININANEVLNRLKYIRNDVVGHPINRRYGRHSIGYAVIKTNNLSYDKFEYVIYVKNKNNEVTVNSYSVDLDELKEQYLNEKNQIIHKLTHYISKKFKTTNIYILLTNLYKEVSIKAINEIKELHYKNFGNTHKDRFLWRLDLIETLYNWQIKDNDMYEFFKYLTNIQINKLITINNSLENRNTKTKRITVPITLKNIFKYLNEDKDLIYYLHDLHDINSPYYGYNLSYLLNNVKNEDFLKLLNILRDETNRNKIYLIGSIFNNFYKKTNL